MGSLRTGFRILVSSKKNRDLEENTEFTFSFLSSCAYSGKTLHPKSSSAVNSIRFEVVIEAKEAGENGWIFIFQLVVFG